jgi:hypothetical protein
MCVIHHGVALMAESLKVIPSFALLQVIVTNHSIDEYVFSSKNAIIRIGYLDLLF